MRKWKMILASVLAVIVLTLVPLSVMAQTTTTPNAVTPAVVRPDLVIVAPRAVMVNKEMQLTVFQRDDQAPVAGVDIWAVTKNKIEAFKKNVQGVQKENAAGAAVSANATSMARFGQLLGTTGANGALKHTFTENGNYLLVAVKTGFRLDFASLIVRGLPEGIAISNPSSVKLGDKVTITVHQRGGSLGVPGADVWAIGTDKARDLKGILSDAQAAVKNNPRIANFTATLKGKAISLGTTDANGQIKDYLFANAGRYILVAFKTGDAPAFGSIAVLPVKPAPTATVNPGVRPNSSLPSAINNKNGKDK